MTPATKVTFFSQLPAPSKTSTSFLMVALGIVRRATLPAALLLSFAGFAARSQTATINWALPHQVIDGFGASNAFSSASMSSAHQSLFFGTGSGQLGLSLLRVAVPDASGIAGKLYECKCKLRGRSGRRYESGRCKWRKGHRLPLVSASCLQNE